jgi:RIO kinase 1
LVTDANALDTELGLLKTGKEADVHLLSRGLPGGPARPAGRQALPSRGTPHVPS